MAQAQTSVREITAQGRLDEKIVLDLLDSVDRDPSITQRSVALELGIALGLANAYLKRCVRKGLIKVQQIPSRRYAYYLTPQGFTEKSRLAARYLSDSFAYFRRARKSYGEQFSLVEARGWRRAALFGASELAEIAMLCAREHNVEVIGIVDDPLRAGARFLGLPVVASQAALEKVEAAIVTDLAAPQRAFDDALAALGKDRVFAPDFLRIRRPPALASGSAP